MGAPVKAGPKRCLFTQISPPFGMGRLNEKRCKQIICVVYIMSSVRSAFRSVLGKKTRKYNKVADIDQSISKLDPDDISKQILKDPSLTPRRGRKLKNLLDMREYGKKHGLTGKQVKETAEKTARRMMDKEKKIDEEADLIIRQINDEAAMDLYSKLPSVPRGSVTVTGQKSKSRSATRPRGGKKKTSKRRSYSRR